MTPLNDNGFDRSRDEAVHWFIEHQSGDMTEEDRKSFEIWLNLSEQNRQAYAQVDRVWAVAGAAAQDTDILNVRAEYPKSEPQAKPRRRWMWSAGLAASLLIIGLTGWAVMSTQFTASEPVTKHAFLTERGQRTDVTLEDGSSVTLDAGTKMTSAQSATARDVILNSGRAHFRVAKDAGKPFTVLAKGKAVRAIGTAFTVSIEGDNVVVTLVEGKVRVTDRDGTGTSVDMAAGRQLIARTDKNWTMRKVDTEKESSWTSGQLTYIDTPLHKVVSDVNRYSKQTIRFTEGHAPNRNIVGVFEAGDTESFIKAMELNDIARVEQRTDTEIIMRAVH